MQTRKNPLLYVVEQKEGLEETLRWHEGTVGLMLLLRAAYEAGAREVSRAELNEALREIWGLTPSGARNAIDRAIWERFLKRERRGVYLINIEESESDDSAE